MIVLFLINEENVFTETHYVSVVFRGLTKLAAMFEDIRAASFPPRRVW